MKKIAILLSFVFAVTALTGCSLTGPTPDVELQTLDDEMNTVLIVEEQIDNELAELETEELVITDNLDAEFDNAVNDEIQIDEELGELESLEL